MFISKLIPARNLQKFYKSIIEGVKDKNQPVVLMTNNKPQAAIVSLEDLNILQQAKAVKSTLVMVDLAEQHKNELKNLPADLREKADEILYT